MKLTREAKIGLFAVICLASFIWGINFLKGKDIFSRTNTFYAIFNRIDGLKNTNHVLISGFKVGTVKDIRLEAGHTGRLVVTLLVEKKYPIPHNSVAKLVSSDIMGGKAIKFELSARETFHTSGDTILSSIETGLVDQLIHEMVPVKEKAEQLMDNTAKVMKTLLEVLNEQNRANLDRSFASLRTTLEKLESTSTTLDSMLTKDTGQLRGILDNVNSISKNLADNSKNITNIVNNFSSISDSLAKANIASTFIEVDSVIKQFNIVVEKINNGEGTLGQLATNDTLYHNLAAVSKNLEILLEDMKSNPKRYVHFSLFGGKKTNK